MEERSSWSVVCSVVSKLVFMSLIGLAERSLGIDVPMPLIFKRRGRLVRVFRKPNKGQLTMVKDDSPVAKDGFMWVL
jgi:hypothetical protein